MDRSRTLRALGLTAVITALSVLPVLPLQPAEAAARSTISIKLSAASASTGASVVLSGQANPRKLRTVSIQRYSSGRWRSMTKRRTTAAGKYSVLLDTATAGRYSYRVLASATSRHRAATSRTLSLNLVRSTGPLGSRSAYSFMYDDRVARWNPCTTITYRVNPNGAPTGWDADVRGALARITAKSGLRFAYLGTSTALPSGEDSPTTDAKLLIGYAKPGQSDLISVQDGKNRAGMGGISSRTVRTTDGEVEEITSGFVLLNLNIVRGLAGGFGLGHPSGYQGTRGQLLMHELAHTVGLGHTSRATANRNQIMFPELRRMHANFGAGDITGLTKVGATNSCIVSEHDPWARTAPARTRTAMP